MQTKISNKIVSIGFTAPILKEVCVNECLKDSHIVDISLLIESLTAVQEFPQEKKHLKRKDHYNKVQANHGK